MKLKNINEVIEVRWHAIISGEKDDLEFLSNNKVFCPFEISIEAGDNGEYVLKSQDFNDFKNEHEIWKKADKILGNINLVKEFDCGMLRPLKLKKVVDADNNKHYLRSEDTLKSKLQVKSQGTILNEDGTVEEIQTNYVAIINKSLRTYKLITKNSEARRVLKLFNSKDSGKEFINLYKIYEIIEKDVGGIDNTPKSELVTKKQIEQFKHTANSYSALGEASRHGTENKKPPKNPMGLPEAKVLSRTIIENWFEGLLDKEKSNYSGLNLKINKATKSKFKVGEQNNQILRVSGKL